MIERQVLPPSSMEGRVDTDALETWTQGGSGHSWEREEGKGATARVVPARRADSSRPLRSGVVPLDRFVPPGGEIPRLRERDAPKLLVFEGPGASVTLEVARCMARDRAVVADVLYAFDDGTGTASARAAKEALLDAARDRDDWPPWAPAPRARGGRASPRAKARRSAEGRRRAAGDFPPAPGGRRPSRRAASSTPLRARSPRAAGC